MPVEIVRAGGVEAVVRPDFDVNEALLRELGAAIVRLSREYPEHIQINDLPRRSDYSERRLCINFGGHE